MYRRSGSILQDVVVVQVVFRTDCCGHTWVVLGWDGMRMGWDGLQVPRYLGCTAFSDWEHRMVVVAEGYGLYLPR